jgi:hypothetical protein
MVDPKLIAEAFVSKRPYSDEEFVVVHEVTKYEVTSAIGVDVSIGDVIKMRPVLYVRQLNDPCIKYRVVVVVDPRHRNPGLLIRVLNAVFERIEDAIGVEMRAVDAGGAVGIAVKGYKYLFREHGVLTNILNRGGVRVMGYAKRFAPFSVCSECVEVAERIKELQRELEGKGEELDRICYYHDEVLDRLGVNTVRARDVARRALRMARSNVVVDGVGLYLGSDSPRALLSRYEKAAREVSELLERIKTALALEMLLS